MSSEPLIADDASSDDAESKRSAYDFEEDQQGVSVGIFWSNIQLAFRCGVFCVIAGLPVLIPSVYVQIDPNWATMIGPIGILLLVFSLYGNLGLTIQLSYQGFVGTGVACLVTYVMSALMPLGARNPETYYPIPAHAVNVLAIFLGLWLNLSNNFRLFYVCYQCYFYMEFVNPNSVVIYNTSWSPNPDSYLVTTIGTTGYGCVFAILICLIPYPIRATRSCRASALSTVANLNSLMDFCVDYYNREDRSVKIFQAEAKAVGLRNQVNGLGGDLDGMWWEGFDMGSSGQTRHFLIRHLEMMKSMVDNVFALQIAISKEDFGESHVACMKAINEPHIKNLMSASKRLMHDATAAANDGNVDKSEKESLQKGIDDAKSALAELSKALDEHRKTHYPNEVITGDLQAEHFFVYCLSRYAGLAIQYTENMINDEPRPKGICKTMIDSFCDIFNKQELFDEHNLNFLMRGFLSIIICFYFGMYFMTYAGVPSGTGSLLLNKFSGAAIVKNLGRLQAVLISQVVPHLICSVLGTSCSYPRICVQALFMIGWELLTCYIYYSSTQYGYIGCLTAAFGIVPLTYPCAPAMSASAALATDTAFQVASFTKIIQTTIAIIILTSVDLVLAKERASTKARDAIKHSFLCIDSGLQGVFAPRHRKGDKAGVIKSGHIKARPQIELTAAAKAKASGKKWKLFLETGQRAPGMIANLLSQAEFFGAQAGLEPRYWMAPWPTVYYDGLVRSAYLIRADLGNIERAILNSAGKYSDIFHGFRNTDSFTKVANDLTETMHDMMHLVQGVIDNETKKPMGDFLLSKMAQCEGVDQLDEMDNLWHQINGDTKYPAEPAATMEDDEVCRLNVALMMMESACENIASVIKACIKES